MATLWSLVLVVLLLVQSAPQRCSGVDHGSLELWDAKHIDSMEEVNESLKTIWDTIKEGVLLHEKNSEALKDLQSLPELVRHLEELVSNHTNMEQLLSNKVEELEASIKDLENNITENDIKVQDLEKRILEHQEKEEQLEETLVQLNNTEAAQKKCEDNFLKWTLNGQEITRLVQQFNNTKYWRSLRRGLEAVLDHSSEAYIQLQRVAHEDSALMYYVGRNNSTQLVSLLLDAGLPVHTADVTGSTMLHGAAGGGHLQLVKLLLHRGCSVDVRDRRGATPLICAASWNHPDVVEYLVCAGAATTATDMYGNTALKYARGSGHRAVVQYLEQLPH